MTRMPMRSLEPELRAGLDKLALPLTDAQIDLCLDYLDLLGKWSKVYNLTAIREPREMLTHHLLDSLAVVMPLRRQFQQLPPRAEPIQLLDVGAGAGLPGVLIAIACPDVFVTCVDTVAKKAAFIQQAAVTLRLPRLRGLHARVETLADASYDVISSRAFSSLVDFVNWSGTALALQGIWLAMKGKHPADEIATLEEAARGSVEVFHVEQLAVPGLDAERCIIWMRKKAS